MSDAAATPDSVTSEAAPDAYPTAADIDEVLQEFDGDPRAAIAALLRDLATLADDREASVSKGYVRGAVPDAPRARRRLSR